MKNLLIISALMFSGSLAAQTTISRNAAIEVAPGKDFDTKVQVDALYGKVLPGQDKGLMFRQSVLDETNNGNAAEQRDMMPMEEKLKLLNNKKITTKANTNKPN